MSTSVGNCTHLFRVDLLSQHGNVYGRYSLLRIIGAISYVRPTSLEFRWRTARIGGNGNGGGCGGNKNRMITDTRTVRRKARPRTTITVHLLSLRCSLIYRTTKKRNFCCSIMYCRTKRAGALSRERLGLGASTAVVQLHYSRRRRHRCSCCC